MHRDDVKFSLMNLNIALLGVILFNFEGNSQLISIYVWQDKQPADLRFTCVFCDLLFYRKQKH